MATLIVLKNSKISGDNPTKLYPGELAINIADGKLYYGDANSVAHLLSSGGGGGVTQIIAGTNVTISPIGGTGNVTINATGGGGSTPPGGSNTQIQYNNAGAFGGVSNLTWNGTTLSATGSFTGSFTGSLQGTSSYALTASYALNGGGGVTGGTANYIPLWTSPTTLASSALYQDGSGNIGLGTVTPNALLDIGGDVLINGLTVGRGGGNVEPNTVIGQGALPINSESQFNVVIGDGAARYLVNRGSNTIIGSNNNMKPDAVTQFTDENTLSISQGGAGEYGPGLPHIWAPKRIKINTSEKINIIKLNPLYYAGISAEWVTDDGNGNQEVGNIIGTWDNTISNLIVKYPNRYYIGSPSNDFTEGEDGGNMVISIKNNGPNNLYVQITCRLLYRPFV